MPPQFAKFAFLPGLFLFLLFSSVAGLAQDNKFSLSGYISDSSSGEQLIGASIYVEELKQGTATNTYGFYSLTLPEGEYHLKISYLGFDDRLETINLRSSTRLDIRLFNPGIETREVEVIGKVSSEKVKSTEMGRIDMSIDKIKAMPALFGEVDLLKSMQLLPGVQDAGEGNSGFYVRGGGPDQNLVLLDEAVVYNASHLFGFFSVFNTDAIKNVSLTKGDMPAQYGGRLSSVLDISMKEGNNKEFHGSGGIGYIASRLTLEGPLVKDKASFIISGRRTFVDLFLREPFVKEGSNLEGNSYFFYDLNAKLNYTLGPRDRLFLSGYFGKDRFSFRSNETGLKIEIPWGNATTSLRWNHLFSDRLFMNTSAIFSNYNFEFGADQEGFQFKIFSGIRDYVIKTDLTYYPSLKHTVRFGGQYIYHRFTPTNAEAGSEDVEFDLGETVRLFAHDWAVYVNDEFDLSEKIRISAGLRGSLFQQVGPFTRYTPDPTQSGEFSDTTYYASGETVKSYPNLEPRLSARYQLNPNSSIKAAFTQNYQYIHLASFGSVSLPTDVWVPSTDVVNPQFSTQYSAGYFRDFKEGMYETSAEVYYKTMKNQIEYREGTTPDQDVKNNTDNNFVFGEGWSYGLELFVNKTRGRLNGWLGYSLSWTWRQFDEINSGNKYPAKYDRRHDISLVASYQLTKRWQLGMTWVYATGDALTLPSQRYFFSNNAPISVDASGNITTGNNIGVLSEYGERNSYRQKPYHRMDITATLKGKEGKKWQGDWVFGIYNIYWRYNPYFIYFAVEGNSQDGTLKVQAKQVSLFGMIPSVTYNFRF